MKVSENTLRQSNVPRNLWAPFPLQADIKQLVDALDDLEERFIDGENFYILGGDFTKRTKVVAWFIKGALTREHHYFRSVKAGMPEKPTQPNVRPRPFTARIDQVGPLVELKLDEKEPERFMEAIDADIFGLTEVGVEFSNRMTSAVIDEVIRIRYSRGLMTLVTVEHDIRQDPSYKSTTQDILDTFTQVKI